MSNTMADNAAALAHLESLIKDDIAQTKASGYDTLLSFKRIGLSLIEAKDMLKDAGKGAFGAWCEERFNFSKEWRSRLMRLANDWAGFTAAKAWAEGLGRVLGRKEYSVDGALALIAEWLLHDPAGAEALGEEWAARAKAAEEKAAEARQRQSEREAKAEGAEGGRQKAESEAEQLRAALAEALAKIKALEAELRGFRKDKAKAEEEAGAGVDAATKARARKAFSYALRGATAGERAAGRSRVRAMAEKAGLQLTEFFVACGLDLAEFLAGEEADAAAEAAATAAA
jgi:hypothetical protein